MKLWRSQGEVSPNRNGFLWGILMYMHHPLGGIEFLVWEILMSHDECVVRWSPPPNHLKILPYNHYPLQHLPLPCVWPLVTDEGVGVQHPGD